MRRAVLSLAARPTCDAAGGQAADDGLMGGGRLKGWSQGIAAFRKRLHELVGSRERTVAIEYAWRMDAAIARPKIAPSFVRFKVDVIRDSGRRRCARQATSVIPIGSRSRRTSRYRFGRGLAETGRQHYRTVASWRQGPCRQAAGSLARSCTRHPAAGGAWPICRLTNSVIGDGGGSRRRTKSWASMPTRSKRSKAEISRPP